MRKRGSEGPGMESESEIMIWFVSDAEERLGE